MYILRDNLFNPLKIRENYKDIQTTMNKYTKIDELMIKDLSTFFQNFEWPQRLNVIFFKGFENFSIN
jgi:hypothetical protein